MTHFARLLLAWLLAGCAAGPGPDAGRIEVPLNDGWTFAFDEHDSAGGASVPVSLPHTWNATDGLDKTTPYRQGVGIYRRELTLDPGLAGRTLYLRFEGANQVAELYVNGRLAGRHRGGYTAFAVDLGGHIVTGGENRIEVRVDNRLDDTIPPLNADFTFYGGLYRDVSLLALGPVHFELDEYGATAVRITTPDVSADRARIDIDARVRNTGTSPVRVQATARVVDAEGREVGLARGEVDIAAGGVAALPFPAIEIAGPSLWSPESPYLYRVICTLDAGGRVLDELRYPLGLRWFEADAARGFLLNGEPYPLRGTNRHQDRAGFGNALPDALHQSDLEHIKADGFNFLRLAHYPQDPAVLDAADELGLILWEEIPIVNIIDLSDEFAATAAHMLREMIRQHRHHPSIAFWGYMNEVTLRKPDPVPAGYYDAVIGLARTLDGIVKAEDPSRPTVMALSRDEIGSNPVLQSVADILAFNLYFGWYYEDFDALGTFLDDYHAQHPDMPLMVSEYGAGSDGRVHTLEPEAFDFSIEYQQAFHEANFAAILDRPWLVGSAVWNQFDFGSNHRQDTLFGINQKGLWTWDRKPKDVAFYYRAQLRTEPILHIATRDWQRRAGSRPEDAAMPVKVYSNAESVELELNGESLGIRRVRNATAAWDVRLREGRNRLSAKGGEQTDTAFVYYEDRAPMFAGNAEVSIAINAGGNEQVATRDGRIYEADRAYTRGGGWGYVGGTAERTHHRVFGTDDDPLYQTRRRGPLAYRVDLPDGDYCLRLYRAGFEDFAVSATRQTLRADGGRGLVLDVASYEPNGFVNAIDVDGGACPEPID